MKLNKDATDLAERSYQLEIERIKKEYDRKRQELRFISFTQSREDERVAKLLPDTLQAMSDALVNAYFEAFALQGTIPIHSDLVELDRKD